MRKTNAEWGANGIGWQQAGVTKDLAELKAMVDKLKANLTQMTEEQKVQYKAALSDLKKKIATKGSDIAKRVMWSALDGKMKIKKEDDAQFTEQIEKIVKEHFSKQAGKALTKDFDVDNFKQVCITTVEKIEAEYEEYKSKFLGLYAAPECFEEPYPSPKMWNELTDEFLVDGRYEKHPEWKSETACIITNGACKLLADALREKESKENGQQ